MTERTMRCFLLRLPSNVTLVVCGEYLFCLILYCTNCTTCNMIKLKPQKYNIGHWSCWSNLQRAVKKQTWWQFTFLV